jgi:hypothetical protein
MWQSRLCSIAVLRAKWIESPLKNTVSLGWSSWRMPATGWQTCFASDVRSGLSSSLRGEETTPVTASSLPATLRRLD